MNKLKRIALVGGTGFVGSHLAAELTRRGYATRIPSRRRERNRDLLVLPTCDVVQLDVHDPAQLRQALTGCDAVINLVGILNQGSAAADSFEAAHVSLARSIVDTCCDLGIARYLHMSALNASAQGPSSYLSTKHAGEAAALAGGDRGLGVTVFRPSVIFGPDDSFFNRFLVLLKMSPGIMPLACPNSKMAPVYVNDVVKAFADSLEDAATYGKTYELAGPTVYTLRELVEYTAKVAGLDRDVVGLSDSLSRLQAWVLGMVPGKPFSLDNYRSLQVDAVLAGDNGLTEFGIDPTPLETIVPRYIGLDNREGRYSKFRQDAARR